MGEKVGIRQATRKGYIECEVGGVADFAYPDSLTRRGRVCRGGRVSPTITAQSMEVCKIERNPITWGGLQEHQTPRNDGISPALTAAMGMGGGQTPIFAEEGGNREMESKSESGLVKIGQVSSDGSQCGSVYADQGNMPTLTHGPHGDANPKICTQYRIRKLTPKECWRLMAFSDEDFERAESVNSNTQLYKQAGNSIVVAVLEAIFRQMLPPNFFNNNVQSDEQKQ